MATHTRGVLLEHTLWSAGTVPEYIALAVQANDAPFVDVGISLQTVAIAAAFALDLAHPVAADTAPLATAVEAGAAVAELALIAFGAGAALHLDAFAIAADVVGIDAVFRRAALRVGDADRPAGVIVAAMRFTGAAGAKRRVVPQPATESGAVARWATCPCRPRRQGDERIASRVEEAIAVAATAITGLVRRAANLFLDPLLLPEDTGQTEMILSTTFPVATLMLDRTALQTTGIGDFRIAADVLIAIDRT